MSIVVVTDSTAYLPEGCADRFSVRVVPLHVSVDGADPVDESDFGPGQLAEALDRKHRVTTSGATAAQLGRVYREALDGGADGVVSVHLSRWLSGTWNAARWAAREVDPERVLVVDSRSAAMGLGLPVLAAAASASEGAPLEVVGERASAVAERASTLFTVPTMEHLRRGGRVGTTAAFLGTALAIKPLLHVRDGRIAALEKVRTTGRAVARLLDLAVQAAGEDEDVVVAVHHLAAPARAQQLAEEIRARVPGRAECVISEVGAVIGAHIGPGAVGLVVLPGGWKSARSG